MLAERATPSLSELRALLARQALRGGQRLGGGGAGNGLAEARPLGPDGTPHGDIDGDGAGALDPASVAPTGVAAVDRLLGGGLPRGKLSELCGPRSSGRTALALAALGASTEGRGEVAALIDVGGSLDARRAEAAGVVLDRLLWARVDDARAGVQAADVVLAAGGFGLVVLDLGEVAPRLADASWMRLGRAAEKTQTTLLVLSPRVSAGAFSSLRLEAGGRRQPRFLDPARGRVLLGLDVALAVPRARHGVGRGRVGDPRGAIGEGSEAPLHFRLR